MDIVNKLIREQDLICYYLVNDSYELGHFSEKYSSDPEIDFSDLLNSILNNDEVLKSLSVKNLLYVLTASSKENSEKIKAVLMERLKTDKFFCESIELDSDLKPYQPTNKVFNLLNKEELDTIVQGLRDRLKSIEGTKAYEVASQIHTVDAISSFLTAVENGIFDNDEKLKVLKEIIESNPEILNTMNFGIFSDELFSLGEDFTKNIAKFSTLSKELIILSQNNPNLFKVFANQLGNSKKLDYEKISAMISYFTRRCFDFYIEEVTPEIENALVDYALIGRKKEWFFDKIQIDYSPNYHENLIDFCDGKFETSKGLDEKKNILLNKYFGVSLMEANKIMESYPEEVKNTSNDFFRKITEIIELQSMEEIDSLYENYSGSTFRPGEVSSLLNAVKEEYSKKYVEALNETQISLESMDYEEIEYDGKRIKQIALSGEFDLLVHSSDAGFVNSVNLKDNSFKSTWSQGKDPSNHIISMSYINENFLGCAPVHGNGVMYAFTNLENEKIGVMGKTDINTYSRYFGYQSATQNYLSPQDMTENARRVYTEVGVEREGTIPSYVVLFSDATEKIKLNSYKAASEFGIPILFVDKELIKNEQLERLDSLIDRFKETKDISLLGDILTQYETNVAGWLLNRSGVEVDKSFTKEIDNSSLKAAFDEKFSEIKQIFSAYMDHLPNREQNHELLNTMKIFLRENDKYIGSERVGPISQTHISYDPATFISRVNDALKEAEMVEYMVNPDSLPTETEYNTLIQDIVKFALRSQQIDMGEVKEVDYEKANRNRSERIEAINIER